MQRLQRNFFEDLKLDQQSRNNFIYLTLDKDNGSKGKSKEKGCESSQWSSSRTYIIK
jgi:hypothetical protein